MRLFWVLLPFSVFAGSDAFSQIPRVDSVSHETRSPQHAAISAGLPLSFEPSSGQTDSPVKFVAHTRSSSLYLTDSAAVVKIAGKPSASQQEKRSTLCMDLPGANPHARVDAFDSLPGHVNYLIGNDPSKWRTNIPTFAKVKYSDIYPGVDLVYYGNQEHLEFDFLVNPGVSPTPLRLHFAGAAGLHLSRDGDLLVAGKHGAFALHKPEIYQIIDGSRRPVSGGFRLLAHNTAGFRIGEYDRSRELIVDPVLAYSTLLGGSGNFFSEDNQVDGDWASAIAVDKGGNAYVTGTAHSTDFPITPKALQKTNLSASSNVEPYTAFVSKLSPSGKVLIYSTYLGGSGGENGTAIAVNNNGEAFVAGNSRSTDFPVTANAFQKQNNEQGELTGFIVKLNANGSALEYATYLGGIDGYTVSGNGGDQPTAIAIDSSGNAYVVGITWALDFPVVFPCFQEVSLNLDYYSTNALFMTKINPTGSALVYSTYLGPTLSPDNGGDSLAGVAVDAAGNAYIVGTTTADDFPVTPGVFQNWNRASPYGPPSGNAFVGKMNSTGTAFVYFTYLGGTTGDSGSAIAIDDAGDAYVTGVAQSSNFPVSKRAFQTTFHGYDAAFVAEINPNATKVLWSTFFSGTNGGLSPAGIGIDQDGNVYVGGTSQSSSLPVTSNAFQKTSNGQTPFFFVLNPHLNALIYATYLHGSGDDVATAFTATPSGDAYITGWTLSSDFPTTEHAFQRKLNGPTWNAFIAHFKQ